MKKRKKNHLHIKGRNNIEMDLMDFLEVNYEGISQLEIAKELGVNSQYVDRMIEEIEQDY